MELTSAEDHRRALLCSLNNEDLIGKIERDEFLTKEEVYAADFTAMARLAGYRSKGRVVFPQVAEAWLKHTGLCGLPIGLYLTGKDGKRVIIRLRGNQLAAIAHAMKWESTVNTRIRLTDTHPAITSCYANNGKPNSGNTHGVTGSILKMEMGLGKTLTAIAWCLLAPPRVPGEKECPTLVLASKTVMGVWRDDGFGKFGIDARVLYYHPEFTPTGELKKITRQSLYTYDFVVTTYDIVVHAAPLNLRNTRPELPSLTVEEIDDEGFTGRVILFYTPWKRIIADESQRFANPATHTYKSVMSLFGHTKLCLTGTPIRNYATDLWAQLRFCGYHGTMRKGQWKRFFTDIIDEHKLLDVVLSQDYDDTDITLPEKIEHRQHVVLRGLHKKVYDYTLGVVRDVYDEMLSSKVDTMSLLALMLLLRLVCIAPHLLTDKAKRTKDNTNRELCLARKMLPKVYDKAGPLWNAVKNRFGEVGIGSAKIQLAVDIIESIPRDKKVIVFSMFTCSLDLLKDALEEKNKVWGEQEGGPEKILQFDGDVSSSARKDVLHTFKTDESARILLMTYKTGGEGINLPFANHIIELEPWWTDAVKLQAEARVWRPGQENTVHIYPLYAKDTIEEHVLKICSMKNELIMRMFGQAPASGNGALNMATIGFLLGKNASLNAPKRLRKNNIRDRVALRSARLRYYGEKTSSEEKENSKHA